MDIILMLVDLQAREPDDALLEGVEEEEPRDADGNYRRDGVALDERGNRQESPRPHV